MAEEEKPAIDLGKLSTEARNPRTMHLDEMSPLELVEVMNSEDAKVAAAVHDVLGEVAVAVEWARDALGAGGRIVYFGAGTSGRLGVLDAVECPPTFGVSPDKVVGLIAGWSMHSCVLSKGRRIRSRSVRRSSMRCIWGRTTFPSASLPRDGRPM